MMQARSVSTLQDLRAISADDTFALLRDIVSGVRNLEEVQGLDLNREAVAEFLKHQAGILATVAGKSNFPMVRILADMMPQNLG